MAIIKYKQSGSVSIGINQGEFNGKPTYSFLIKKKKFNEKTKQFEETEFYNMTDLPDLINLCQNILSGKIKEFIPNKQQNSVQTPSRQNEGNIQGGQSFVEDIPF